MELRRFSTFLTTCILLAAIFASPQSAAQTRALDEVAVVVNGQAISTLDLQRRERFLRAQLQRSNQPAPNPVELSQAILERAIFETLMLQSASKQGLVPSDSAVQQAIADNAMQSGLELNQFLSAIERSGISTEEYTFDFKNELAMAAVRERAMLSKLKISDAEVERFLRDAQSGIRQEYQPLVLRVTKTEGASSTELANRRAQAQALHAAAISAPNNESFAALQPRITDNIGSAEVNLGFNTLDKLPELYSNALENMNAGEVSPLLESSAGFYIIRLANKRMQLPQVQQTKARHILLRVENAAAEERVKSSIKSLHDRLTLNIDFFPELAKSFSQDGSSSKGGELGWSMAGDMVPEFERVMDSLKPGEMGLPLRSQFGWHIVQVLERKTTDIPQERLRGQARNVLRTRKQDEALSDWLDQMKAQAYIEYKQGYKP
jgi:peptidyl-prolyl cis-trans isomerase SurA